MLEVAKRNMMFLFEIINHSCCPLHWWAFLCKTSSCCVPLT
nr:MAG TPA: hypothetical protein [Bacteriophage sp.]